MTYYNFKNKEHISNQLLHEEQDINRSIKLILKTRKVIFLREMTKDDFGETHKVYQKTEVEDNEENDRKQREKYSWQDIIETIMCLSWPDK